MTGGVKGCHREAALPPPLQRGRQCVPLLVAMTGRMLTGQAPESAPSSLTGTALSTCHFRNARDDEAEGKSRWSGGTGLPREEQQRKRDLGEAEERGEVHGGQGVCRGGKCDLGCLFWCFPGRDLGHAKVSVVGWELLVRDYRFMIREVCDPRS